MWWSLATITTVGYGDMYPVTTEGRFIAAGLMFCGIGVLGVVTGSFASWLVERVEDIEEDIEEGITADSLRRQPRCTRRSCGCAGALEDSGAINPEAGGAASTR